MTTKSKQTLHLEPETVKRLWRIKLRIFSEEHRSPSLGEIVDLIVAEYWEYRH